MLWNRRGVKLYYRMEAKSGYMWNNFRRTYFEHVRLRIPVTWRTYNNMSLLIVSAKKIKYFRCRRGRCQTAKPCLQSLQAIHTLISTSGTCLKDFENNGIKLGCVNSAKRLRFLQLNGCSDQSVYLRGSQNTQDPTTHDMRKRKEANAVLDSQTRSN